MELVVLVDEKNNSIGTMPKADVHTTDTQLHRGFSLFLFNSKHELLLTRRALSKKTFAGVWTNTVCGHPAPDETVVAAATRRLSEEMGIEGVTPAIVIPYYKYKFADSRGIYEHEICPVLIAYAEARPHPKRDEIEEWKWVSWSEFLTAIDKTPEIYSPWCRDEARLLTNIIHFD